jgi:flagellin-like protein
MMKLFSDKKGVSPVVSAVIMILIVMIGMSALFAFFVNYSRDFQLGSGSAVLESLTVEDVWFKSSGNVVELWVYNFGKVDVTITDVYVDSNAVVFTPDDLTIGVGEHGKFDVVSSFDSGVSYRFKIVTERGTSFEGTFTW